MDWNRVDVVELSVFVFIRVAILCLGTFLWYMILSFHEVELALITRRMRFQFAHVPYIAGRYAHLITLLTIAFTARRTEASPIPSACPSLAGMQVISTTADIAVTSASCNLALRAMVLWKDHRRVLYMLRGVCAVHLVFGIVLGLKGSSREWDPTHTFCTIGIPEKAKAGILTFLLFTVTLDISILALTVLGIRKERLPAASPLTTALAWQGIGYGVITVLTCIPMAVMAYLPLNAAANVMLLPPGCTVSVIASSAAVSSLLRMRKIEKSKETEYSKGPRSHVLSTKYPLSTIVDLSYCDTRTEAHTERLGIQECA